MRDSRHIGGTRCLSKPYAKSVFFLLLKSSVLTHFIAQVIQQSLGQQVSQPVAQIVAGFAKVFVGEIVEKGV